MRMCMYVYMYVSVCLDTLATVYVGMLKTLSSLRETVLLLRSSKSPTWQQQGASAKVPRALKTHET